MPIMKTETETETKTENSKNIKSNQIQDTEMLISCIQKYSYIRYMKNVNHLVQKLSFFS